VGLKALAQFQANNNEMLMSGLTSVSQDQIEPAVTMVKDLKGKIDKQVTSTMRPINSFSVTGSLALFALT
jgi:hypothetical protein